MTAGHISVLFPTILKAAEGSPGPPEKKRHPTIVESRVSRSSHHPEASEANSASPWGQVTVCERVQIILGTV